MGAIISAILLGISLCADCFAVSLCSSTTVGKISFGKISYVGSMFAIVQAGLLMAGWAVAYFFADAIGPHIGSFDKIAHIIAFVLLFYVGGNMIASAIKKDSEQRDLGSLRNVLIGAVATSIDAFTVGISMALSSQAWPEMWPIGLSVLIFTYLSVLLGMYCGTSLGARFGHPVQAIGGIILIILPFFL